MSDRLVTIEVDEIEITEEMLKAGEDVILEWLTRLEEPTHPGIYRKVVRAIFEEMFLAKHQLQSLD